MRDNISRAFDSVSSVEMLEGLRWYEQAKMAVEKTIAIPYSLSLEAAVGVVAVLSPGCGWRQNLDDAAWLMANPNTNMPVASYKSNVRKALRIHAGENPSEVLRGRKVIAFAHNLLYPESSPFVTIDRHAVRVALNRNVGASAGSRLLDRSGVYDRFSEAYTLAAERVGILGLQMQASVWISYRNKLGINS